MIHKVNIYVDKAESLLYALNKYDKQWELNIVRWEK